MLDRVLRRAQPLWQPSGLGGQFDGVLLGRSCFSWPWHRRRASATFLRSQRRAPRHGAGSYSREGI